jgi:hypothetical protein
MARSRKAGGNADAAAERSDVKPRQSKLLLALKRHRPSLLLRLPGLPKRRVVPVS